MTTRGGGSADGGSSSAEVHRQRAKVLSHFSLSRHHPFDDRVRLAALNGFSGIGFYVGHFIDMCKELGHDETLALMRTSLDHYGVRLAELEVVPGLGRKGAGGEQAGRLQQAAWELADQFGSRYLQVIGPSERSVGDSGVVFGELCDEAADHGLVVGLEFLPYTDIATVVDARAIVEAAARDNGGVCVDIWHHERGLRDLAAIAALPSELITGIQFNDGSLTATLDDYKADCLAGRVPPGDGEFDIAGFLAAVAHAAPSVPISFEVCSITGWDDADAHIAAIGAARARLFGSFDAIAQ
jgi:sugar phosphate isomerase/epimerase